MLDLNTVYSLQVCLKCRVKCAILSDTLEGWFYYNAEYLVSPSVPPLGQTAGPTAWATGVVEGDSTPFCIRCASDLVVEAAGAVQTEDGDWIVIPDESRWPGLN